jgi:hypothetical protein
MKRLIFVMFMLIPLFSVNGESLRRLESRVEQGIAEAQYKLGLLYYTGLIVYENK